MRAYTMSKAMGAGLLGTLIQTILVYGVTPLGSAHLRVRQPQPAWAQTLVQTRLRLVG
jgi:hypothetical protein